MSSKPPVSPQEPDFPDSLDLARGIDSLDQLSLERALLELAVVAGKKASDLRIEQCRLVKLDLSGAELVRASIADSVVEGGSWANVRTDRLRLNRVALKGVRMTGASLVSAVVEDVTFEDCRIDLAFFASARLRRVRFRKCNLDEVDFFGAALKSVAFDRCSLIRGRWTDSSWPNPRCAAAIWRARSIWPGCGACGCRWKTC